MHRPEITICRLYNVRESKLHHEANKASLATALIVPSLKPRLSKHLQAAIFCLFFLRCIFRCCLKNRVGTVHNIVSCIPPLGNKSFCRYHKCTKRAKNKIVRLHGMQICRGSRNLIVMRLVCWARIDVKRVLNCSPRFRRNVGKVIMFFICKLCYLKMCERLYKMLYQ